MGGGDPSGTGLPARVPADPTPRARKPAPLICISFDVEQFDIPTEYGIDISIDEQFKIGRDGLVRILDRLQHAGIPATFFVTAEFALRYSGLIGGIAENPRFEIASHGYTHGDLEPGHLEQSRRVLEQITHKPVFGFRRARMAPTDAAEIARAGYSYNASENPIWLPGRYNHFFRPRRPYIVRVGDSSLVQIPASATPLIRIPLFWLAFKNLPLWFMQEASLATLVVDGAINTYFHPWEFTDLASYALPRVVKRVHGDPLLTRLTDYLIWMRRWGEFATYNTLAQRVRSGRQP